MTTPDHRWRANYRLERARWLTIALAFRAAARAK